MKQPLHPISQIMPQLPIICWLAYPVGYYSRLVDSTAVYTTELWYMATCAARARTVQLYDRGLVIYEYVDLLSYFKVLRSKFSTAVNLSIVHVCIKFRSYIGMRA